VSASTLRAEPRAQAGARSAGPGGGPSSGSGGSRSRRWAISLLCFLLSTTYLIPLLWVMSLSVRTNADATSQKVLPATFRPANFPEAFDRYGLGGLFANSVIITTATVVITVAMSVFAAYGFARWKSRLTEGLFLIILLGLMIPPATVIVPFFIGMQRLGLYNSLLAVILAEAAFGIPLGLLILRGYIDGIPIALTDAARVDGAGPMRAFYYVVLPLLRPALVTVSLFIGLFTWNDFLIPLVLMADPSRSTLTVGLAQFNSNSGQLEIGLISAAAVMATLPVLTVFFATRRYYVLGLGAGAVKG
jgi:ABC-type glycerol-3-phosphate transport system permease component